jgi:hypothetical protein
MRKTPIVLFCCLPLMAYSQVLDFVSLNTRQIEQLDRSKTVVIIAGGILEEHGPICRPVLTASSTKLWLPT